MGMQGLRMGPWLAVVAWALSCAGCAGLSGNERTPVALDPSDVAWGTTKGTAGLRGSAVLRPPGGEVRTCAGATVALLPDSAYTRDRLLRLYGSLERGRNDLAAGNARRIEPADPAYARAVRTTTCDIHGRFAFSALPEGIWYVTTSVTWRTRGNDPASQAGAALMQRVTLKPAGVLKVDLGSATD